MRKLFTLIILLLIPVHLYADADFLQRVSIEPLNSGVTFTTVTVNNEWVTCTTAFATGFTGRRVVNIYLSSGNSAYLYAASGNTSLTNYRTLYSRESVTFGISSRVPIYASSGTCYTQLQITEIR